MVRTVKGITLTPAERSQAGYAKGAPLAHSCSIPLPSGVSCTVSYSRSSSRTQSFAFGAPLHRTQWVYEAISGGIPGIEAKAATLAELLFHQAQQQEQRTMRQKAPASRAGRHGDTGPQLDARTAERLAGLYAVCVKQRSGSLLRIGATYPAPEGPLRDIQDGTHRTVRLSLPQQFVVGICNRAALRWEEPAFLAGAAPGSTASGEIAAAENGVVGIEGDTEDGVCSASDEEYDPESDDRA